MLSEQRRALESALNKSTIARSARKCTRMKLRALFPLFVCGISFAFGCADAREDEGTEPNSEDAREEQDELKTKSDAGKDAANDAKSDAKKDITKKDAGPDATSDAGPVPPQPAAGLIVTIDGQTKTDANAKAKREQAVGGGAYSDRVMGLGAAPASQLLISGVGYPVAVGSYKCVTGSPKSGEASFFWGEWDVESNGSCTVQVTVSSTSRLAGTITGKLENFSGVSSTVSASFNYPVL